MSQPPPSTSELAATVLRNRTVIREVVLVAHEQGPDSGADVISQTFKRRLQQRKQKGKKSRSKTQLTLDDLALKMDTELFPNSLKLKSSLYVWIIFLMGTFYTVPVLQLILGKPTITKLALLCSGS